jgi:hypothetical protein
MKRFFLISIFYFLGSDFTASQTLFSGQGGIYYLGSADNPVSSQNFSRQNISGVVVRFKWETIEPSPGVFNWTLIDGELSKAITYNKKISLQPLGKPLWLKNIGCQFYYYQEKNPNSPNNGQIVIGFIPWDTIYINRLKNFILNHSVKYGNDSNISYVNAVAVHMSRNLPDTVIVDTLQMIKQPFWTAYPYNADTLAVRINSVTDYYMSKFPITPLWCSVDYVRFEMSTSGRPINYLASLYTNYGITNYPQRFGLFREDISGCVNTNPAIGSHWYIMKNNACRTGAQMLWSVQDGPIRMNQCGIAPNSKQIILDSAIGKGIISFGMRYMEVYGADIEDTSLTNVITEGNSALLNKTAQCISTRIREINSLVPEITNLLYNYPNPFNSTTRIIWQSPVGSWQTLKVYDVLGKEVATLVDEFKPAGSYELEFDANNLPSGVYFYQLKSSGFSHIKKMMLLR